MNAMLQVMHFALAEMLRSFIAAAQKQCSSNSSTILRKMKICRGVLSLRAADTAAAACVTSRRQDSGSNLD
jgi:hypothetical protein